MDANVIELDAIEGVAGEPIGTKTELSLLELAIVGGGIGDVVCH